MKKGKNIRKRLLALCLAAALLLGLVPGAAAAGAASGGRATYEIGNADQLAEAVAAYNAGTLHATLGIQPGALVLALTADIDLTGRDFDLSGWGGYPPLGTQAQPFRDRFDGQGHTIRGLRLDSGSARGLFGVVEAGGVVENLALTGCSVTGGGQVGGVAGVNRGVIRNCLVSGFVCAAGTGSGVGGICGENGGKVEQCIVTADVGGAGNRAVGGIAGTVTSGGTVTGCAVLGGAVFGASDVGAVAGVTGGADLTGNLYWSGMSGGAALQGTGADAAGLADPANWPEGLKAAPWTYEAGKLPDLGGRALDLPASLERLPGGLTEDAPIEISDYAGLLAFARSVNVGNAYTGRFILVTADIAADPAQPWTPIDGFAGTFDGGGYTISGLTVPRDEDSRKYGVGLFGAFYGGAPVVKNVHLTGCDITGYAVVGGIVGYGTGATVSRCSVQGKVTALNKDVGGVCGAVIDGKVSECYANVTLHSEWGAGGIVSYLEDATVENCVSAGLVSAQYASSVGGLAAHLETESAQVLSSYTLAAVESEESNRRGVHAGVGGAVGASTGEVHNVVSINKHIRTFGPEVGRTAGKFVGHEGASDNISWLMPGGRMGAPAKGSTGYTAAELIGGDPDWAQVPEDKLWAGFDSSVWDLSGDLPALRNLPSGARGGGNWPDWLADNAEELYQRPQMQDNTYIINTAAELAWLSRQGNDALNGKTIDIRRDLSLKNYQDGDGWTPIGTRNWGLPTESLTVKGNGNTISDLYISSQWMYTGLFAYLRNAVISGIRLENAYVERTGSSIRSNSISTAGIVAACGGASIIQGCSFSGTIQTPAGYVGGIVGDFGSQEDFSYIQNCSSGGVVHVSYSDTYPYSTYAGGIVGHAIGTNITECFNSAQVSCTSGENIFKEVFTGGIAGTYYLQFDTLYNSGIDRQFSNNYNRGNVTNKRGPAGGLIGEVVYAIVERNYANQYIIVLNMTTCYSLGEVQSDAVAGGLIGAVSADQSEFNIHTETLERLDINTSLLLALNKRVSATQPSAGEKQTVLPGLGKCNPIYNMPGAWRDHIYFPNGMNFYWDGMALERNGDTLPAGGNQLAISPMDTQVLLEGYLPNTGFWPSPWQTSNRGLPILKNNPGEQSHGLPPYLYLKGGAALGPIAIYTAQDMADLRELMLVYREKSDWTDITIDLMADIDMEGVSWEPLNTFQGVFNGNGHVLRNLNVYSWSESPMGGLFRELTGRVSDLGLVDCNVTAPRAEAVGALAGTASGEVSGCYAAQTPSGQNDADFAPHVSGKGSVGGLVGRFTGASIRDCYTALNVYSSEGSAGGLVGELIGSGSVERCFTAGAVKAAEYAGGLVGKTASYLYTPALSGCFALNPLISGIGGSGGIVGFGTWSPGTGHNYVWNGLPSTLTSAPGSQYQLESLYTIKPEFRTVFGGSGNAAWFLPNDSTPMLRRIRAQQYSYLPVEFTPGTLTKDNGVYLIETAQDLQTMAENVSLGHQDYAGASYRVTADLDLSTLMGWQPIDGFYGTFDGGGHLLSGLRVSLADVENGGLFGLVRTGGTVKNFTLEAQYTGATQQNGVVGGVAAVVAGAVEGVTFRGSLEAYAERTGGIAGLVEAGGRVAGCVNEAAVQNTQSNGYAGGIAGVVTGLVETCVNGGTVKSAGAAGGVAGGVNGGTVERCLNLAAVTGGPAGGVAGRLTRIDGDMGVVRDCHAAARVESGYAAGGVVGMVEEGIPVSGLYNRVEHCYATGQVKGKIVGGIAGINHGVAQGCGALSEALDGGAQGRGQIAGAGGGSAVACFAWTGMTGADPDPSVTGVTSGELRTQGIWSGAGFDLDRVWTKAEGEPLLPVLTGLGRGGELPLYLMGSAQVDLPQILRQPQGRTVPLNTEAALDVTASATGGGTLRYQWYETTQDGPTDHDAAVGDSQIYTLRDTPTVGTRYFYVDVSNTVGPVTRSVRSDVAAVEVVDGRLIGRIQVGSDMWERYTPPEGTVFNSFFYNGAQMVEIGGTPEPGASLGTLMYLLRETPAAAAALPGDPGWSAYTGPFQLSPNRRVIVYASVSDSGGNTVTVNSQGLVFDDVPPTVAGCTPSGGDAPVRGTLQIAFNEPMDPTVGTVVLEGGGSLPLSPALSRWSSEQTYEIDYAGLDGERTYTVAVSGFRDRAGNVMAEDRAHSFTAAAQGAEPSPVYPGADPLTLRLDLNGAASGDVGVSLGQYGGKAGRVTITNGAPEALALSAEGVQYGDFTLTVTGTQTVSGAAVTLLFNGGRLNSPRTVTITVDVIASQPSGGGGGGGTAPSGIAIETPQPPRPVEAVVDLELTVQDGQADGTVDGGRTASALRQALAAAKRLDREEYGVALRYRARAQAEYGGYAVVLDRATLERLAEAGVKYVSLDTDAADLSFDREALGKLLAQSTGPVTLTAAEAEPEGAMAEAVGGRRAYRLEAGYTDRAGKRASVTAFGAGRVTVGIPYSPVDREDPDNLFLAHERGEGGVEWLYYPGYRAEQGVVSGRTAGFSLFGVGCKPAPDFTDTAGHWAEDEIAYTAQREMFQGTGEGRFSPDLTMTRAMFVTTLYRLAGAPQADGEGGAFPDVPAGQWYSDAVAWCAARGIVNGTGAGFSPDRAVTREEMAAIVGRFADSLGYALPEEHEAAGFTDGGSIAAWAADAVASMQRSGILRGKDGNRFDPTGILTRAEAAVVFQRFTELCAAG